jgi:hypothetical protein
MLNISLRYFTELGQKHTYIINCAMYWTCYKIERENCIDSYPFEMHACMSECALIQRTQPSSGVTRLQVRVRNHGITGVTVNFRERPLHTFQPHLISRQSSQEPSPVLPRLLSQHFGANNSNYVIVSLTNFVTLRDICNAAAADCQQHVSSF